MGQTKPSYNQFSSPSTKVKPSDMLLSLIVSRMKHQVRTSRGRNPYFPCKNAAK